MTKVFTCDALALLPDAALLRVAVLPGAALLHAAAIVPLVLRREVPGHAVAVRGALPAGLPAGVVAALPVPLHVVQALFFQMLPLPLVLPRRA